MKTPLPLRGTDQPLKIIRITVAIDHFVENSFLHLLKCFPTLGDVQGQKISKYHQKLKKSFFCIFMVYPQKFEDCEIRQDQQVSQKNFGFISFMM
jgi:hypothetical protein